jgi:hypothetical protein
MDKRVECILQTLRDEPRIATEKAARGEWITSHEMVICDLPYQAFRPSTLRFFLFKPWYRLREDLRRKCCE